MEDAFEYDEEKIPTAKVINNLLSLSLSGSLAQAKLAILVSTGSYCPVHRMHIQIFDEAKSHLERHGYTVIGGVHGTSSPALVQILTKSIAGYISPSHDLHVACKLGPQKLIAADHRLKMCEMAVCNSDWVCVSSWESRLPHPVNFVTVVNAVQEYTNRVISQHKELNDAPNIEVFYVCGADLIRRCRLWRSTTLAVVGIARPGTVFDPTEQQLIDNAINETLQDTKKFYWVKSETEDISSTKIRNLMDENNWKELEKLTFPEVAQYLLSPDVCLSQPIERTSSSPASSKKSYCIIL